MLILLALAAGVGAFAYAYGRIRQIQLASLEHAEGLARGISHATDTLSRLIALTADVLQLLIPSRSGRVPAATSLPWDQQDFGPAETDTDW